MVDRTAHRPNVMSREGMVASGHPLASMAGARVLMSGGNAFDATIATSAALTVLRPHMCSLGGDAFCLLHQEKDGKIQALNASGPAPRAASRQFFLSRGHKFIPETGLFPSTVPGLVASWAEIHQSLGTKSLADLLAPAIDLALNGFPLYPGLVNNIDEALKRNRLNPSATKIFAPSGRSAIPGEILVQPDLAKTLQKIAKEGCEAFYRGSIAESIAKFFAENEGLLDSQDLRDYRTPWRDPIKSTYQGFEIFEQPPVSQGIILLEELNIIEGFDLTSMGHNSAEAIHLMVEAKKLAFSDRLAYLADPDFNSTPVETLSSKEHAAKQRERISLDRANNEKVAPGSINTKGGDTTYFTICDRKGNASSFIQSIFYAFGSGTVVDGTGILMNNRLVASNLEGNRANSLEPGKKPIHTLNTFIVLNDGRFHISGGTPGLDDQVQINLQLICNMIDFEMDVQTAIEAPRWSSRPGTNPTEESNPYQLLLENRIDEAIVASLQKKGHKVATVDPWSFGGAQIINRKENGVLIGGADPRREGYVIGC